MIALSGGCKVELINWVEVLAESKFESNGVEGIKPIVLVFVNDVEIGVAVPDVVNREYLPPPWESEIFDVKMLDPGLILEVP